MGQAGRTQLPGRLAGCTAFCLRLGNRDISQPALTGRDQRIKHANFGTSLNGSHGYKGLRIKLLAELGVKIFTCQVLEY